MSNELNDTIEDSAVKTAFESYRADPGGGIRLDTTAITAAGWRRVQRNRFVGGAAGVVAVAALVGGITAVPQLLGKSSRDTQVASAPTAALPSTGRDVNKLFSPQGVQQAGSIKARGAGETTSRKFLAQLDEQPDYLDSAWQAEGTKPKAKFGLATWVDGDTAAEGLLEVQASAIYIAIYPAPYQVCGAADTVGGRTCAVREVKGKGWLKVVRKGGAAPELTVTLQRMTASGSGSRVQFTVTGGAATKAGLAGGRTAMGRLPVDEKDVTDAVLTTT